MGRKLDQISFPQICVRRNHCIEEKETISYTNFSKANQERSLTEIPYSLDLSGLKLAKVPPAICPLKILLRVDTISQVAQKTKIHSNIHLTLEYIVPLNWQDKNTPKAVSNLPLLLTMRLLTSKFIVKSILNRNITVYIFTREKNVREICHDGCLT